MPKMTTKKKVYAVARGRKTGIFDTWEECSQQVNGYAMARFKSFRTREEALSYLADEGNSSAAITATTTTRTVLGSNMRSVETRSLDSFQAKFESQAQRQQTGTATTDGKVPIVNPYRKTSQQQPVNSVMSTLAPPVTGAAYRHGPTAAAAALYPSSRSKVKKLKIHINFDGGSRGNPGLAGAGAAITLLDISRGTGSGNDSAEPFRKTLHIRDFLPKKATNNEAEYQGLLAALRVAKREAQDFLATAEEASPLSSSLSSPSPLSTVLVVQGDSELIIKQLKGIYRCNNFKLKPLYAQVMALLADFKKLGECQVFLEHVYRDSNATADMLANQAMDAQRSWMTSSDHGNHAIQMDLNGTAW